jgi:DNA polymerase-3 subunit epsilon
VLNGRILHDESFDEMVDPRRNIPLESLKIHEIDPEMLKGKPLITEVLPRFQNFVEGAVLVAHNAAFDMKFLQMKEVAAGVKFTQPVLDTLLLSAAIHPHQELHNLEDIAERFGLPILGRHTALGDSILTAEALLKIIPVLDSLGIQTLKQAREASAKTKYHKIKF